MRTKYIKDNVPLIPKEVVDMENPVFVEKVKNSYFEKLEKKGKYSPVFKNDFCRQVYHLSRAGFTDEQIGDFFGVGMSTITQWKNTNSDFIEAYMQGKNIFHFYVVESLTQRALGYDYEETEISEHLNKKGEVITTTKRSYKHVPPDVGAMIFWLTNRQSDTWKNTKYSKTETVNTVNVNKKLDLSEFNEEEQKMIRKIMIKQLAASNGNAE